MVCWCCSRCFGDSFLDGHIRNKSKEIGDCSYCSSVKVPVVEPGILIDNFQSVCAIYSEDTSDEAKSLVEWFGSDWEMFKGIDHVKAQALLGEILNDGEAVRKKYSPVEQQEKSAVEVWNSFRDDIVGRNRYFYRKVLNLDRIEQLFNSYLETDASIFNKRLFRARIQKDNSLIPLEEMGKPPANKAKNGRANPVGIPYLYTASTRETAIAETRPHPGDLLTVAQIDVREPLRLINLQHPRDTVSPFSVEQSELPSLRLDLDFLSHLGNELSKPVLPRVADLEYLTTQYLCEFVKDLGYDGVVFRSSLGDGFNVTLFDDVKVNFIKREQYKVTYLHYDQMLLPSH